MGKEYFDREGYAVVSFSVGALLVLAAIAIPVALEIWRGLLSAITFVFGGGV